MAEKILLEEIEIPEGINAKIENKILTLEKENKKITRKLNALINVEIKEKKIIISAKKTGKSERKMFGTMKAHIKNMVKGLTEGFSYELHIANVHFPMNVSYNKESNEVVVKNFLGEKKDRRIKLADDVDVKINKEIIEITSHDIEKAGQSATNIEKGTKVRNKDRRIFQDGIFLASKPGRKYM